MNRKKFTLVELLVVLAIIGVLIGIVVGVYPSIIEKAKQNQVDTELNAIKIAMRRYQSTYNKPPKKLEDLLSTEKSKNPRGQVYFDSDEIPEDPYAVNEPYQIVTNVQKVEVVDGRIVEIITNDRSRNIVVYSVGPNGKADGDGDVEGGLYGPGPDGENGTEDDWDDISVLISF